MDDKIFRCACFTGHREIVNDVEKLRKDVKELVIRLIGKGVHMFICGGALGFDLLCGEIVLEARSQFPSVKLVLAAPCPDQELYYPVAEKRRYAQIREGSEFILCTRKYHKYSMMLRNQYMVDRSAYVICYLRKSGGGTYQTRSYAQMKGREIFDL